MERLPNRRPSVCYSPRERLILDTGTHTWDEINKKDLNDGNDRLEFYSNIDKEEAKVNREAISRINKRFGKKIFVIREEATSRSGKPLPDARAIFIVKGNEFSRNELVLILNTERLAVQLEGGIVKVCTRCGSIEWNTYGCGECFSDNVEDNYTMLDSKPEDLEVRNSRDFKNGEYTYVAHKKYKKESDKV